MDKKLISQSGRPFRSRGKSLRLMTSQLRNHWLKLTRREEGATAFIKKALETNNLEQKADNSSITQQIFKPTFRIESPCKVQGQLLCKLNKEILCKTLGKGPKTNFFFLTLVTEV